MKGTNHSQVACYLHARRLLRVPGSERRRHRPHSIGLLWLRNTGISRTASIVANGAPHPCLTLITDAHLPAGSDVELCYLTPQGSIEMIRGRIEESRAGHRATDLPPDRFFARFEPYWQNAALIVTDSTDSTAANRAGEIA